MVLIPIYRQLRAKHWIKNVFVFVPAFFSQQLYLVWSERNIMLAFLAFCSISSLVYIVNDYLDVGSDRKHPIRRNRSYASGRIGKKEMLIIAIILGIIGVVLSHFAGIFWWISAYFFLNVGYSFYLKHLVLLDVATISLGFLLRVWAGGAAAGVEISAWLLSTTFLLAFLLALGKRKETSTDREQRSVTNKKYPAHLLDPVMKGIGILLFIVYMAYCLSPETITRFGNQWIFLTSIFAAAGLLRYFYLAGRHGFNGDPTQLVWTDRIIQLTLVMWMLSFYILIY